MSGALQAAGAQRPRGGGRRNGNRAEPGEEGEKTMERALAERLELH